VSDVEANEDTDSGDDAEVEATDAEVDTDADSGSDEAPETAVAVLEYLAKALVADPDGVRVEADDSDGLTLNVYVADGDMGRVIGKRGRVANAIRSIGRAAAAKDGETGVAIEFVD